ncbi:hypothetical protein Pelo_2525 [Pelomyxa schiedti]|nr:hypothetical protein Pelo_2525 [Pelomyxa schiedti]
MFGVVFCAVVTVGLVNIVAAAADVTAGNLLITQPNEVFTQNYLAEMTPEGKLVQFLDLGGTTQPIDVGFDIEGTLILLDFRNGVHQFTRSGEYLGFWGDANPTYLTGESFFDMTLDNEKQVYIIDLDPTNQPYARKPVIYKFNNTGGYAGVAVSHDAGLVSPDMVAVDDFGSIWVVDSGYVKKFSADGEFMNEYQYPIADAYILSGIMAENGLIFVGVDCEENVHPDNVLVIDYEGNLLLDIPLEGNGGGCPAGMALEPETGLLYVENSDSEIIGTQHIQVYNYTSGTFVRDFGGAGCGVPLCQTFNGIAFVPF